MPKNNEGHITKVSPFFTFGGYLVSCDKCGKIGRGKGENKKRAKQDANRIASDHRASNGGPGWLGF